MSTSDRGEGDDAAELAAASGMLEELDLPSFDPEEARGFDGIGESFKSLLSGSASMGRTLMMTGAPAAMAVDRVRDFGTDLGDISMAMRNPGQPFPERTPSSGTSDAYFGDVVEGLGTNAVDSWRPDPSAMGATAQALSTVNTVVGYIPSMIGTPSLFLANAGIDPTVELTDQGVDLPTAAGVGAVNFAVNAIGMKLPAAFGSTLATRVATGAGSNLALGVAADASSNQILESGGYTESAEGYDAANPYARGLDLLMGLAFGAKAHVDAPRLLPSQKDAVLVALNADHYQRGTMPGAPASQGADVRHQGGLDLAIEQILRGEPVDVADVIRPEDFTLRPELRELADRAAPGAAGAGVPPAASYAAYRHALESGGRADARPIDPKTGRRLSEAYGTDQFIPATWRAVVAKAKPAWAEGMTDAQLLEARSDPAKSAEMVAVLDAGHAASLEAASLPVTRHTLYASHHFGINKGKAFARAGDSTRMELILTAGQLEANQYLRGKTKAEAIANWDDRAAKAGVDLARVETERAPSTAADTVEARPLRAAEDVATAEVPRPAIETLRAGETLFPEPPPRATLDEYAAWMEGRQRAYVAAERRSMQAILDGRPGDAQAALPTAQRMTAAEAQARIVELDRMEAEAPAKFAATDPIVRESFEAFAVQDREQAGRGIVVAEAQTPERRNGAGRTADPTGPDVIGEQSWRTGAGADAADRRLAGNDAAGRADPTTEAARSRGNGDLVDDGRGPAAARSADGLDGPDASQPNGRAGSQGRGGRNSPDAVGRQPLATAEAITRIDPTLRIPTGELDADGNPITTSADEYLAAAKAEAGRAEVDALAIHAAADCFLRSAA